MSRQVVLRLYKDILRYGETVRFTNKKYFRDRIQTAFRRNKGLSDEAAIDFQLKKGMKFLEAKRVV
ncbi:PREDICTED: LYR motif-containing protein 2 [Vollenhovia emeryi]|uniref:LYR motif-containing protein 2 n=1 Tax=Vollenhovia emeryi TaxID=411798 RepID=UPI0005F58CE6|nr:PREDICTED: LYR motif-containing protein 2 [Vollenhovia emeryi]